MKRRAVLGAFMVTPRVLPPVALIDDNPDDLFFMQQRLQRAGIANPIIAYEDGEEAMAELAKCGSPERPVPCVLFLDLRMPRCGGFEVLKWVREQRALDAMRVVIVSTSTLPEDAARATRLGAARFLTKYPSPELLGQIVTEALRGGGNGTPPAR